MYHTDSIINLIQQIVQNINNMNAILNKYFNLKIVCYKIEKEVYR